MDRNRLLPLGAALAAFGLSLSSGFHFDDYAIFSDAALTSPAGGLQVWAWRMAAPLTQFTFWLSYLIGGNSAPLYHVVNLALHLGAVMLLYECLRRLAPEAAVFGAAVFALHPIQAGAVDYISARAALLGTLLCLASLLAWIDGKRWAAVAAFAVAVAANESCAALPVLFLMAERLRNRPGAEPAGGLLKTARSPQFLVAAALAAAGLAHAAYTATGIYGPWRYFLGEGPAVWRYLRLLVVPYGFTVDPDVRIPALWLGLLAWALLLGAAAWAWRANRRWAMWLVAGFALLLPSSSLLPARDLAADWRMYLPMAAFAAAAGIGLARVKPAAIAVLALLTILSFFRTQVWMSEQTLWAEAVRRSPEKVRPKVQLARALPAAKALELLEAARPANPNDPTLAAAMGKVYLDERQPDAALENFSQAITLDPSNAEYYNNRGVAYALIGLPEAARADFEHALAIRPAFSEAQENLRSLPQEQ